MWKYDENANLAFKIEFKLTSVNILGTRIWTRDLTVPESP